MPNHVHLLVHPIKPVSQITQAIKSTSARTANELLGRAGHPFWQIESYDHWVRNRDERHRIIRYIERNPVKAGLVDRVEDWPWSSACLSLQRRPEARATVAEAVGDAVANTDVRHSG